MDGSEDAESPPEASPEPRSRPPAKTRNRPPSDGRRPPPGRSEGRRPAPSRSSRGPRPAPPRPAPARPDSQRRLVVLLSVLTAAVVTVGVLAFALASGGGKAGTGAGPSPTTTAPGTPNTVPASQLTTFRDDVTGFSVKYPRNWEKADIPTDGDVRLVLLAGGLNGVSVRVSRTEVPTTTENLANIKAVTDGIVGTNPTAKVLDQRQVTLNGMPGYYYLYTFTDEETGAEGAHGHYFLFKGRKMNSIIFQTIPPTDFAKLAPIFDQVAESFQSDPDLAPAPTTTTAPAG